MSERAEPLITTLSIREGSSVGRLVTDTAAAYGINLAPDTTNMLQAVNHLVAHVDSRLDGDKPNSLPAGDGVVSGSMLNWRGHFTQLYDGVPLRPGESQLTAEQNEALAGMRASLDANQVPNDRRQRFAEHLLAWIEISDKTKFARNLRGENGYVQGRYDEGAIWAAAYMELLPDEARTHPQFDAFGDMLARLMGGYRLMDSFLDLPKDARNHNTVLRHRSLGRIGLLVPIGLHGIGIAVRKPSIMPQLVRKALAARANADDSRNTERTQV